MSAEEMEKPFDEGEEEIFNDALQDASTSASVPFLEPIISHQELSHSNQVDKDDDDGASISSNELITNEEDDKLAELDPNSREYRMVMVRKLLDDARSARSYSTTASTIAPSVVTDRVKGGIRQQEKKDQKKRAVPKGEASAVRRMRKDNNSIVKEYRGWDF